MVQSLAQSGAPVSVVGRLAQAVDAGQRRQPERARELFEALLAGAPAYAEAWYEFGQLLSAQGSLEAAEDCFRRVQQIQPEHSRAAAALAEVLIRADQPEGACAVLNQALLHRPDHPRLLRKLGDYLAHRGQATGASACHARAYELDPTDPDTVFAHFSSLIEVHRSDEVRSLLARGALTADPVPRCLLEGKLGLHALQGPEAETAYRAALRHDPSEPRAHLGLATCLMLRGDLKNAWQQFALAERLRSTSVPWFGARYPAGEPLDGKRVLVTADDPGLLIQYSRYLPSISQTALLTRVACPQPLAPLLRCFQDMPELVAWGVPCPDVDYQLSLMEAVSLLETTPGFVDNDPVVSIPPARRMRLPEVHCGSTAWRDSLGLGANNVLQVGVLWDPSPTPRDPLPPLSGLASQLLPALVAIPGVRLFSLQTEIDRTELSAFGGMIVDLGEYCAQPLLLAAILSCLDIVITVTAPVLHLAATLGRPTWGLCACPPDPHWGTQGVSSSWYADLRLFRQGSDGAWAPVVRDVVAALRAKVDAAGYVPRSPLTLPPPACTSVLR